MFDHDSDVLAHSFEVILIFLYKQFKEQIYPQIKHAEFGSILTSFALSTGVLNRLFAVIQLYEPKDELAFARETRTIQVRLREKFPDLAPVEIIAMDALIRTCKKDPEKEMDRVFDYFEDYTKKIDVGPDAARIGAPGVKAITAAKMNKMEGLIAKHKAPLAATNRTEEAMNKRSNFCSCPTIKKSKSQALISLGIFSLGKLKISSGKIFTSISPG